MKNKKVFSVFILLICISLILCTSVFAWTPEFDRIENSGIEATATENDLYNIFGRVVDIVTLIGVGIALVILVILGIQYVIGSVEKKAEIKKQAQPYVIGVIIIFAASAILQLASTIITSIAKSIET